MRSKARGPRRRLIVQAEPRSGIKATAARARAGRRGGPQPGQEDGACREHGRAGTRGIRAEEQSGSSGRALVALVQRDESGAQRTRTSRRAGGADRAHPARIGSEPSAQAQRSERPRAGVLEAVVVAHSDRRGGRAALANGAALRLRRKTPAGRALWREAYFGDHSGNAPDPAQALRQPQAAARKNPVAVRRARAPAVGVSSGARRARIT